jgi:hypothetical protein
MDDFLESTPDESPAEVSPDVPSDDGGWEPNYGFKVKDEEHEFDDWVRPAIQSKEHEEKLRELYTKAFGLDGVKSRLEENERRFQDVHGKYSSVNTQYEQMQNGLQKLGDLREKDFSTFRKVWQIPDHRILEEAASSMIPVPNNESRCSSKSRILVRTHSNLQICREKCTASRCSRL